MEHTSTYMSKLFLATQPGDRHLTPSQILVIFSLLWVCSIHWLKYVHLHVRQLPEDCSLHAHTSRMKWRNACLSLRMVPSDMLQWTLWHEFYLGFTLWYYWDIIQFRLLGVFYDVDRWVAGELHYFNTLGESITGIGDRRRSEIKTYGWETYYEVLCCPEQTRQTSKISQFSFSEQQNGDAYSLDIATLLRLVPHTLHCNLETMFHLDQPPNKKSNCQRNVSIILNCVALVSRA